MVMDGRFLVRVLAGCCLLAWVSPSLADSVPSVQGTLRTNRLDIMVAQAELLLRQSADVRVLAVNALKNAASLRDQVEAELWSVYHEGRADEIRKLRRALDQRHEDLERAMRTVEQLVEYSADIRKSAGDVLALAKGGAPGKGVPPAEDPVLLRRIEKMILDAEKPLKKVQPLAEDLKMKWLIHSLPSDGDKDAGPEARLQSPAGMHYKL